jgi:hypothetical protein
MGELKKIAQRIQDGSPWNAIFPGVASLEITTKGYGPSFDLRISKKEGIPVQLVPAGTPGATVVAVKRVDELGFYNLSLNHLAQKIGLTGPRTTALIRHLKLQEDPDCFRQFSMGKAKFNRYSQKAIEKLQHELPVVDMEKVWEQHGPKRKLPARG